MKRKLYFTLSLITFGPIIWFVVKYLLGKFGISSDRTQPIVTLSIGLFWIEFFRVKYRETGLWQIVSASAKDKISLVLHLIICTFLIGWTYQLDVLPIYIALTWLILLFITGLSFYLFSTQEAKPLIKKYFFDDWYG